MTRTRRAADVRREEILRTTVEELQRTGFAATRVADVAEAMGVSTALIHYHFASKEKLLSAAFAYAAEQDLQRLDAALAAEGTAAERLAAVLRLYVPTGKVSTAWSLWIDAWGTALRWPELRRVSRVITVRWQDAFETLIAEGVAQGVFTCDDPRAAAWRIVAVLDGLSVRATVHRNLLRKTDLHALVADMVRRELRLAVDPA